MTEDDRLLEALARALGDDHAVEVPPARSAVLRAQVLQRQSAAGTPRRAPWRWPRVAVALAGAVVVFTGGVLVGHDPPRPLRDLAHDVGLPVDSSTLVDARHELDRLGEALATANQREVKAADACMLAHVAELSEGEKAEIVPVAHEVHLRAEQFLLDRGDRLADPGCG